MSSSRAPASSCEAPPGSRLDLRLDQAQRDRQGDEPLLRAVVKVPLERAPRVLLGAHEARARRAQLLCDPLSLGDVEAGDEKKLALVDLRERRAGPCNREASPALVIQVLSCSRRRLARGNRLNEAAHFVGLGRVDELLPEDLAADLRRLVSERALEGDVRPSLRETSVVFDETQEARSVVRDRVQERSLALLLDLEPSPLGDFDARDEHERLGSPCDVGDGDRRPGERTQCPVGAAELRLDLLGCSTGRCRGDRSRGPAVVVLRDQIHERQPDELVVAPAERLPERAVRAYARVVEIAVADRPLAVEHDNDARNRLERSRCRVALALELELALPALGDVEAARDDADDASGVVLHGRGAPVEVRTSPRAFVNAFSYSPAGSRERAPGTARSSSSCSTGVDEDVQ